MHYCCLLPGLSHSGLDYELYKQELRTAMKVGVTWFLQRIISFCLLRFFSFFNSSCDV